MLGARKLSSRRRGSTIESIFEVLGRQYIRRELIPGNINKFILPNTGREITNPFELLVINMISDSLHS